MPKGKIRKLKLIIIIVFIILLIYLESVLWITVINTVETGKKNCYEYCEEVLSKDEIIINHHTDGCGCYSESVKRRD